MTIPRRKKLIEVALPLEAINKESAREKSIRHGHPSTLHLWWARRPLAACRAVLFAQLVDDPESDPAYRRPDGSVDVDAAAAKRAQLFDLIEELVKWENSNNELIIHAARAEIARCVASRLIEEGKLQKDTIVYGGRLKLKEGTPTSTLEIINDEGQPHPKGPVSGELRTAWELIVHGHGDLDALRKREKRLCSSDVVNHFLATYAPPVLDPFAGGGSIPLEAQRLGLRAHASDLNPVPVLINKALIEIPPKFANRPPVNPQEHKKLKTAQYRGAAGLAADVRHYGQWMRDEAEKRIGHLYPKVTITDEMVKNRPDLKPYLNEELTVIAWLWARTVPSPNPAFAQYQVPLVSSFWLSKKANNEAWLEVIMDQSNPSGYRFLVHTGKAHENIRKGLDEGTKVGRGGNFRCILSGDSIPVAYIRVQGREGQLSQRLMGMVCEGKRGRVYLEAHPDQETIANVPKPEDAPDQLIAENPRDIRCQLYGLYTFADLFSPRQLTALVTFSDLVMEAHEKVLADAKQAWAGVSRSHDNLPLDQGGHGPQAYADAVATYLAFGVSKATDYWSALCSWHSSKELIRNTFGRQALPMVWDFSEANPLQSGTGGFGTDWSSKVLERLIPTSDSNARQANVIDKATYSGIHALQRDATDAETYSMNPIISCDPPYYDNIGYADLSDFFYVWLRRSIKSIYPELLSTLLTPKSDELIASPYRHHGSRVRAAKFFEDGLGQAILRWREYGYSSLPTTIFYAFKQSETDGSGTASTGWETFLDGVIEAGYAITGTWPMRTEMGNRMVGTGTNALASSVVLACVPRDADASMATRKDFLAALKRELPDAMKKLQSGNIAPVDLAQAAIGPGMAVFSRYAKVMETDGTPMTVRMALTLINQILDEVLAEQEGEFDGDTRWAVSWFEQHGMDDGPFGDADNLSRAKNTSVDGLALAGLIQARGGKVKLIARGDLPKNWNPLEDSRLTAWEAAQQLIRRLLDEGESSAASLLAQLGDDYADQARDLAYRLYSICERKGWSQEALAYNSLVTAWGEISRLSRSQDNAPSQKKQDGLF